MDEFFKVNPGIKKSHWIGAVIREKLARENAPKSVQEMQLAHVAQKRPVGHIILQAKKQTPHVEEA